MELGMASSRAKSRGCRFAEGRRRAGRLSSRRGQRERERAEGRSVRVYRTATKNNGLFASGRIAREWGRTRIDDLKYARGDSCDDLNGLKK